MVSVTAMYHRCCCRVISLEQLWSSTPPCPTPFSIRAMNLSCLLAQTPLFSHATLLLIRGTQSLGGRLDDGLGLLEFLPGMRIGRAKDTFPDHEKRSGDVTQVAAASFIYRSDDKRE